MYVRLKRQKQTYFLHCEPSDTVKSLKEKVTAINNQPTEGIGFYTATDSDIQLSDDATLQSSNVVNDSILCMVYKSGDGWENIQVDNPEDYQDIDQE
jgi:hypothetical protein